MAVSLLAGCETTRTSSSGGAQRATKAITIDTSRRDPLPSYAWTPDHMQVGVRWQPFDRPQNNAYDAARPVIAEYSSYAQFWVSWAAAEPQQANTDYGKRQSNYLKSIEWAIDACAAAGVKVELVFWHCPAWASVSGEAGGQKPRPDEYSAFVTRIARHFKGRVHAYQLAHEANLRGFMDDGNIDYLISEVFTKGAKAIRRVYAEAPAEAVIISTSGCSPCEACFAIPGLRAERGGAAVDDFYDRLVADAEMMQGVDALNLNVTDHFDGYGNMDGTYIPSTWGNFDLVRGKLDAAGYRGKKIMAAESWIVWDGAGNAVDVNGDGIKNEQDAYHKAVTIMGQCLQRGLNTYNLPWSDNSSGWSMGLTKRVDYNGRVKALNPKIVVPSNDGGPDVVTRKLAVQGRDDTFVLKDGAGEVYTVDAYINPGDPNHLHYYIWRWYAQIAGGADEVIRHALAGEHGNDVTVLGPGYTGKERYRLSSYNRTKESFTVLLYASGATGKGWATVSIPAAIQNGRYFNNDDSPVDFRGEGFAENSVYHTRIETKDISDTDGSDVKRKVTKTGAARVKNGLLTVRVKNLNTFTTIEFIKGR
jgi:hypothetical protein